MKIRRFYMKKTNWLLGGGLALIGLLVLIFPAACVKIVSILLGLAAIAYGIYSLINAKNLFPEQSFFRTSFFVKSILSILLGILTAVLPLIATAWKVMIYIFAIYLILQSCFGFYTVSILKDSIEDRKHYIFENLSVLLAGVLLILISPQTLGMVIIRIIGIATLLVGLAFLAIQIINTLQTKKNEIDISEEDVKVEDDNSAE